MASMALIVTPQTPAFYCFRGASDPIQPGLQGLSRAAHPSLLSRSFERLPAALERLRLNTQRCPPAHILAGAAARLAPLLLVWFISDRICFGPSYCSGIRSFSHHACWRKEAPKSA